MTLILELPDNEEATLKSRALAQGVTAEEYARRILRRDLVLEASPPVNSAKSLKLPALPLGNLGSLHRRDIYDDAS